MAKLGVVVGRFQVPYLHDQHRQQFQTNSGPGCPGPLRSQTMKKWMMILAMATTVACASGEDNSAASDYVRICKDKNGTVVDNSRCEAQIAGNSHVTGSQMGDALMWWYIGSSMAPSYPVGSVIGPRVGYSSFSEIPRPRPVYQPTPSPSSSSSFRTSRPSTPSSVGRSYSAPSSSFRAPSSSGFRSPSSGGFRSSPSSGGFRSSGGGFRGR